MSKFVYYTDPHFAGENPQRRIDDYPRAILDKLKEIYQVAVDEDVDFVVSAGDIFNGHRMFNLELLGELMDMIRDSGLKTYTVVGQHDIFGYNASSYYKSSTLAFIERRKVGLEVIWNPVKVGDVQLVPSHVWEDPKDAANHELDDSAYVVLVAHHLMTNKTKTMFDTVNTGDFAKWMRDGGADYDMVLSGDLHDGYPVHDVDGMWFCNPGSLARRAISDGHRWPQYAVVEAEPGGIPIIDVRRIRCARSGDDVFGESAADVMRERSDFDPTAFIKEIEEFEVESADVNEMIRKIGKAKGIRMEVLDYIDSKKIKVS